MRKALKKHIKEEDKLIEKIPEDKVATVVLADDKKVMDISCSCGNKLHIVGEQSGWQINFHTGVDFICSCGKTFTVKVTG